LQGQRARKLRVSCPGSCLRPYPYCMHSGIRRSTCWSYQPRRRCRCHLHICRQCLALTRAVAFLGLPSTLRPHRTLEKLLELLSVMGHTSVQLGASMIMVRIVISLHAGRCKRANAHAHTHIYAYTCASPPPPGGRHTRTPCARISCMHAYPFHTHGLRRAVSAHHRNHSTWCTVRREGRRAVMYSLFPPPSPPQHWSSLSWDSCVCRLNSSCCLHAHPVRGCLLHAGRWAHQLHARPAGLSRRAPISG